MTDAQFAEASAFLREVHKNVRLYWTDTTEINQAMAAARSISPGPGTRPFSRAAGEGVPIDVKRDTDGRHLHLGLRLRAA